MAASTKLEPVQIVYAYKNGKIIYNNILEEILLKDDLKDKPVCVVSIAGTFRQGKSFMLNFFLRYLNIKYKQKRDVTNWLNSDQGPLSGFQWKSSYEAVTMGIMMWPEIFLGKLPSGDEVAIILLDTQGTFDNETSIKTCGKLFALSSLISSLQMYNLKEGIKQYDLSHLGTFADYGKMVQSDHQHTHAPFQSILFLIRDWQYPHEFPYGKDGGEKYLDTWGPSQNSNERKLNLKEIFDKITCFLVPHPGKAVATSEQFQGNIMDIEKDFVEHVETLVPTLLAPENLVIKSISGQEVTVSHLCDLIKNFCKLSQDDSLPELQSMHEATMAMQHIAAVAESTIIYENSMKFVQDSNVEASDKEELKLRHTEAKEGARIRYREKKMLGNFEEHQKYENELDQKLENLFTEYEEMNKMKLEVAKENKFKEALEQIQQLLITLAGNVNEVVAKQRKMEENEVDRKKAQDKKLAIQLQQLEARLHQFKAKLQHQFEAKLQQLETKLQHHFEAKLQQLETKLQHQFEAKLQHQFEAKLQQLETKLN